MYSCPGSGLHRDTECRKVSISEGAKRHHLLGLSGQNPKGQRQQARSPGSAPRCGPLLIGSQLLSLLNRLWATFAVSHPLYTTTSGLQGWIWDPAASQSSVKTYWEEVPREFWDFFFPKVARNRSGEKTSAENPLFSQGFLCPGPPHGFLGLKTPYFPYTFLCPRFAGCLLPMHSGNFGPQGLNIPKGRVPKSSLGTRQPQGWIWGPCA